ncbi:hypothetical protein SAMN04487967_2680 [Natronorubrum sediminis]|uniref:Uncharacterized protein n=1 Tax=Natronorubrum sediminis TaxID=640943 RepID=A0A1H6G1P0_9EURY|nr:hypothetical protein SAMN04487967_2680 [Natronorubrum sediminis]
MVAVGIVAGVATRVGADRQATAEFTVGSEQTSESAAFGGVFIETHADGKRQYPL